MSDGTWSIAWPAQGLDVSDDELLRLYEQECEALWRHFLFRSGVMASRVPGAGVSGCGECWSDERASGLLIRVLRVMRARSLRPRRKTLAEIAAARIPPVRVDDLNLAGLHVYVPDELYLKWGTTRAAELEAAAAENEELKEWAAHPRVAQALGNLADYETAVAGRAAPPLAAAAAE